MRASRMIRLGVVVGALTIALAGCVPPQAPPTVLQVDAGINHSCALLSGGRVTCWAQNYWGQLGDGTNTDSSVPVAVVGIDNATQIDAGGWYHTCARLGDGTVKCWGGNEYGGLGDGTTTSRSTPVAVIGITDAVQVAAGDFHGCALLTDSTVKCWGDNENGQLGDGTTIDRLTPVAVPGLTGVASIAAGAFHTCALLTDGTATCWGWNGYGQLGNGFSATVSPSPTAVSGLAGATQLSLGGAHTCALIAGGTVKCWGDNTYAQLGVGSGVPNSTLPLTVPGISGATQVGAGDAHGCAVVGAGALKCWGRNYAGQVGDGTTVDRYTPVDVPGIVGVTNLGLGSGHTCVVIHHHWMKCWGWNGYGQLGNGANTDSLIPVGVVGYS